MSVLLDSVILIDHLNGIDAATHYLASVADARISVVTRSEVMVGARGPGRNVTIELVERFPTLIVDERAADIAADLRREHRWRLPDAFQAALAQLHQLPFATRNTRDFPPERFPFVTVPYRL